MKVTNKGYEFLILQGLTQNPIELKKGDEVVFTNDQLIYGHEAVFSIFDPESLIFEKDVEVEEVKAKKQEPAEPKVEDPVPAEEPVSEPETEKAQKGKKAKQAEQ